VSPAFISEIISRAGLSARAVRFYEAEGLLPPPTRLLSGYRVYTEGDLDPQEGTVLDHGTTDTCSPREGRPVQA
jgi:hypothetical protein